VGSPRRLEQYGQLLGYLRERVERQAGWHALPRNVASWWKARAQMRVVQEQGVSRVVHDGLAEEWVEQATVAWASERGGRLEIDA
jgi:hypothetical protein